MQFSAIQYQVKSTRQSIRLKSERRQLGLAQALAVRLARIDSRE